MVVAVFRGFSLGCHTGMAHTDPCIVPHVELELVAWNGALVDAQLLSGVVGDPRGICSPHFTDSCEGMKHFGFLFSGEAKPRINQTE